jgi:drug/metabolite transporter (DMT)-like permease
MLSERQRVILRRIHRLHQLIWVLLGSAIVVPILMLGTSSASLAPQAGVALAIAAAVCVTISANTICPRCGAFFHSGRVIGEIFTERCESCRLSCRNPDADAE